jgi:hypothetical protein
MTKTWETVNKRKIELKQRFWAKSGWNTFDDQANIRTLAKELDNVMKNDKKTPCHVDKVIVGGSEMGVWLTSHYFKNREGVRFSFDAPDGIGFAGWASLNNLDLVLDAFENWLDYLEMKPIIEAIPVGDGE